MSKEDDLILETKKSESEPAEPDYLEDGEVSDILYGLTSTFNSLNEIDAMLLSQAKRKKLKSWKNKLWNSIDFYVDCLSQADDETNEDE